VTILSLPMMSLPTMHACSSAAASAFPLQRGIHKAESENPQLSKDLLKVLKTQDRTYVQVTKSAEEKVGAATWWW
jgi:hypothetical protein